MGVGVGARVRVQVGWRKWVMATRLKVTGRLSLGQEGAAKLAARLQDKEGGGLRPG